MRKSYIIASLTLMFVGFAMVSGCVKEPQEGLFIEGIPVFKKGNCAAFESNTYRFTGQFDIKVYEYERYVYRLNIRISNRLPSNENPYKAREEGNWVVLRRFKIEYEFPEGWPAADIPPFYYDRTVHLDPGDTWDLAGIEVFSQQFYDAVTQIYDQFPDQVDPGKFNPIFLKITAIGENSAGDEIESNTFYFRLHICRDCTISRSSMDMCCTSPYNGSQYAVTCWNNFLDDEEEDGRCYVYQDRPMIYCSWLADCYYNEMQCQNCVCSSQCQCSLPEE